MNHVVMMAVSSHQLSLLQLLPENLILLNHASFSEQKVNNILKYMLHSVKK
jgi:hypothetical protein